jgi:hypothetical protein
VRHVGVGRTRRGLKEPCCVACWGGSCTKRGKGALLCGISGWIVKKVC